MKRPWGGTPARKSTKRVVILCLTVYAVAGCDRVHAADRLPEGVTPEIKLRIERGMSYLLRTQNADGSWYNMGNWGSYPTAMTALAGTALLMKGSTATRGPEARTIRKAADFLVRSAHPSGVLSTEGEGRSMHGHGFAMLFLAQVYGMEENAASGRRLHDVLTRAVRLTERSQSRAGGWLYSPDQEGDEGSVTVTQIQGLRACRDAGIHVNPNTIKKAVRYIERSANPDGGIRYRMGGRGSSRPPISAAAVATLYNAGRYDSPLALKCLAYCDRSITMHGSNNDLRWGHFYYTHLYFAQAKYVRGGREWRRYYRAICRYLAASQSSDGSWMGDQVGRSYGTALAVIILALPYQLVPIYQR